MDSLVAGLLAWVVAVTSYNAPPSAPTVIVAPASELHASICGEPCPVEAFYDDGYIVLSADRDFDGDIFARGSIIHELVHYLQDVTGRFNKSPVRESLREWEAYRIENYYLRQHGVCS